ncbi:MAG: response regulator receiver protein [Ignavibacteria bacterium GWB2_35_12]|nr:MAG: response regulator receiver protein [Ignavibacteria bacterium GWA2_35_8]OGU42439.1 MAG: response regulator receiver protein [Ignavibacteria bacterium GWB2_35_12]OGU96608.1 MAG: response regulator receiver protein [Ignavibacteria bacterium RIFOXYA2_FULL_35_10]OGV24219.1 MAG: response regulator receiver protein [Ignavibacteria bacterium RIFOXYC2_FULL_35_21]
MPKIAIIDDDSDIVEALTMLLSAKGYSVVSAANIPEAIKVVDGEKPDLILLDVMMDEPDDGFYLANKFKQKGVTIPIIMLTSVSKAVGYEFGKGEVVPIDDFIEKPVTPSVLIEKISKCLRTS